MTTQELLDRKTQTREPESVEGEASGALFASAETEEFRSRWRDIQAAFVDNPKQAVHQADELVAHTIHRLTEVFAAERTELEHGWDRGEEVSTEDLRQAFRRYRSFFDRLLSV